MKNDLEELTTMINGLHKGIANKSEMIPTETINAKFKWARCAIVSAIKGDKKEALDYIEKHIDLTRNLYITVEMTLKHLNTIKSLDTLNFYRLVRCGKLEKDLKSLLEFYQAHQADLLVGGMVSFKMNL